MTVVMDDHWVAMVAPGAPLREAIDNIIRARTGALIVVGGEPDIDQDCEAGFRLDVPFRPSLVYELAKMDGAIILDQEVRRIRRANVELLPKLSAPSHETGMRHRTAERIARTRGTLVIAISQRRGTVSLYHGNERYVLQDLEYILTKAATALNSLSRYERLYRAALRRLEEAEIQGEIALLDVIETLDRGLVAIHIRRDVHRFAVELGQDGQLIERQLAEYPDLCREWRYIWQDYQAHGEDPVPDPDDWPGLAGAEIPWARALGYDEPGLMVAARGVRLLRTVPQLPEPVIDRILQRYRSLDELRQASIADLDQVEGVGPQRARAIWRVLHPGDDG